MTSVTPNHGPRSGGTKVTISANNFTRATAVKFGTTPATSFTVSSNSSITATSLPGSGTVAVVVTTPTGSSSYVDGG